MQEIRELLIGTDTPLPIEVVFENTLGGALGDTPGILLIICPRYKQFIHCLFKKM
jgi:hypothetical protein